MGLKQIKNYWDKRAKDKLKGTYADVNLQQLEAENIAKYIKRHDWVLDVGCGKGYTANYLAWLKKIMIEGIDNSEEMIVEARKNNKKNIPFMVRDILVEKHMRPFTNTFNVVYTERCLINLPTWKDQQKAIQNIYTLLKPGGLFIMLEGSKTGLKKLNEVRKQYKLKPIKVVWHNLFFDDYDLTQFAGKYFNLIKIDNFCSTYMLVSRALHPALVAPKEPKYSAKINELAASLPSIGDYGYQKIYVFKKI